MKYKSFQTERLYIRPQTLEDAKFMLALLNSPKWIKFIGDRNVHSIEDAENYITEKVTPQFDSLGYSNYTLVRKDNDAKIGVCGLYDREGLEGVDLGFAMLPAYEGKGYGYESANRLMEAASQEFKLKKVSAITTKENLASQNLLEKLNFRCLGKVILPDDTEELLKYEIDLNG